MQRWVRYRFVRVCWYFFDEVPLSLKGFTTSPATLLENEITYESAAKRDRRSGSAPDKPLPARERELPSEQEEKKPG